MLCLLKKPQREKPSTIKITKKRRSAKGRRQKKQVKKESKISVTRKRSGAVSKQRKRAVRLVKGSDPDHLTVDSTLVKAAQAAADKRLRQADQEVAPRTMKVCVRHISFAKEITTPLRRSARLREKYLAKIKNEQGDI